jgi:hypothetical protein
VSFAALQLHQVKTGLAPISCRTCTAYTKTASRSFARRRLYQNHL